MTEILSDKEIEESLLETMNVLERVQTDHEHRYVIESGQPDLLETLMPIIIASNLESGSSNAHRIALCGHRHGQSIDWNGC